MQEKRKQLFIIYSLSIIMVTAIFSLTIFYSVSFSEERRIEKTLQNNEALLLEKINLGKTTAEIVSYIEENQIDVVLWWSVDKPQTFSRTHLVDIQFPLNFNELEKLYASSYMQLQGDPLKMQVYSLATPVEIRGEKVVIQIVYNGFETATLLDSLMRILFFGTLMVSFSGIGLGIILAFLNMRPVIKSWNQQKAFVADASHELRTPLSIITLKSDQLLSHSEETIYEHIQEVAIIHQECRRMHKMVDDLLFLAKRDSGVVDIEMKNFSTHTLATELEALYSEFFQMADKKFEMTEKYSGEVLGDYQKIKQVCMIIIDNALKFTEKNQYIACNIEQKGNRFLFTISNNGIPLNQEEIPKIFDRFYKSDSSRNRDGEAKGNGLGLSIAKEILHLHQSKIRANITQGITSFSFSLLRVEQKK
ncbi:two-component sensor histidine kinase [Erysipelotrichaceae bacterium]|nr:two-component sensor histidine kinase [Erysipelotrichaceae bacterium]